MLTRDQLLGSFERRYCTVPTRIGELRLRNLTEGEKSEFEAGSVTSEGKINLKHVRSQRRRLIALTLVDEQGELLLTSKADIDRLKEVDSSVTSAIMAAATDHCGFDADENEELEKNLSEASDADSPTGLRLVGESST